MPKLIEEIPLVAFRLNYDSDVPLYKQLYDLLRKAILEGKIMPGQKLPGTRSLAAELKISRNTVAIAFDLLRIEGYISGRTGSGSFVNEIPDNTYTAKRKLNIDHLSEVDKSVSAVKAKPVKSLKDKISPESIAHINKSDTRIIPFQNGIPAINEFPFKIWLKIINKVSINIANLHLGYGDSAGYKPLREAIASYLRTYRAVNCSTDQIIIVNGSQQGLDLIGRVLLKKGSNVWLEDPCYFGIKASMLNADAAIHPCPLDDEGININYSDKHNPKPDLIYTTPSYQFPLGITMSVSRRIQLLNYAEKNNCWIIEDDYDSEFRYVGSPLPSLQGMDKSKSVLYLGTFSKVLFPGLRMGYLVLPDKKMTEDFMALKFIMDRQSPILDQTILAHYLNEGHFTRHIRKMRMLYKSRQEFLINEINKNLNGLVKVKPAPSGMQLILWLPENINDKEVTEEAFENNLIVNPLSNYSIKFFKAPGIILGYTAFDKHELRNGVQLLKKTLDKFI
jgi:GntR family transcriptional regulator / MocR family aminotransferase